MEDAKHRKVPGVDEVLVVPTVVAGQLYELVADERSLEECRGVLAKALDRGRVGGDVWAKVRLNCHPDYEFAPGICNALTCSHAHSANKKLGPRGIFKKGPHPENCEGDGTHGAGEVGVSGAISLLMSDYIYRPVVFI